MSSESQIEQMTECEVKGGPATPIPTLVCGRGHTQGERCLGNAELGGGNLLGGAEGWGCSPDAEWPVTGPRGRWETGSEHPKVSGLTFAAAAAQDRAEMGGEGRL